MNIVMMTNTYTPHVGGVARSVDSFVQAYRARGHDVLVVAPEFAGMPKEEDDVIRIPAIQNFNGSDFSFTLPIPGFLEAALEEFDPDIIHTHHPFLIGSTALRAASRRGCPLVFTHHTMYEQYTHYVPGDSPAIKRFIVQLSTSYANLCDQVLAPSESIAAILRERGVHMPLEVVPTGVPLAQFEVGRGADFRRRFGIPEDAFVIGHVGRLAPEKNLDFLARAVAGLLRERPSVYCLVVGAGPSEPDIRAAFQRAGCSGRLILPGKLILPELADAYHAMDCFAFASLSETQGMVLAEAMAAGLPVVAVDAPGAHEMVRDGENGFLLPAAQEEGFRDALRRLMDQDQARWQRMRSAVAETAQAYSLERCADKALAIYDRLDGQRDKFPEDRDLWHISRRRIRAEWKLLKSAAKATGAMRKRDGKRRA